MIVLLTEYNKHDVSLFVVDPESPKGELKYFTEEETRQVVEKMIWYFENCKEEVVGERLYGEDWMDIKDVKVYESVYMEAVNFDASEEHHGAKVDSILEFVKNMEDDSSYVVSIKSLANSDYFRSKFTGFVASMVICYNKAMEKERKQKEEEAKVNLSEYIGNKGDRLEANFKEVKVVASYDTQFGMMTMYQFTLDNDDICIWSTGNYINTDEVKSGKIKFTVKDHSQFRGVKQTVVTRCKLSA